MIPATFRLADCLSARSLAALARAYPATMAALAREPQPADAWACWEPAAAVERIMRERPEGPQRRVA